MAWSTWRPAHIEIWSKAASATLNPALADEVDVLGGAIDADQLHLVLQSGLDDRVHHDGGRGIVRRIDPVDIRMRPGR